MRKFTWLTYPVWEDWQIFHLPRILWVIREWLFNRLAICIHQVPWLLVLKLKPRMCWVELIQDLWANKQALHRTRAFHTLGRFSLCQLACLWCISKGSGKSRRHDAYPGLNDVLSSGVRPTRRGTTVDNSEYITKDYASDSLP